MYEILALIVIASALAAYLITNEIAVAAIGVALVAILFYSIVSVVFRKSIDTKYKLSSLSIIPVLLMVIAFIAAKLIYK